MRKKNGLSKYEPPRARDLSGLSVRGDGPTPMGICTTGFSPTSASCTHGPYPAQQDLCFPWGVAPEIGYCESGSVVAHGCFPGSFVSP